MINRDPRITKLDRMISKLITAARANVITMTERNFLKEVRHAKTTTITEFSQEGEARDLKMIFMFNQIVEEPEVGASINISTTKNNQDIETRSPEAATEVDLTKMRYKDDRKSTKRWKVILLFLFKPDPREVLTIKSSKVRIDLLDNPISK